MKQTAVEWFWLNLTDDVIGDLSPEKILKIHELIEQAKAMEKEQIENAYNVGKDEYDMYRTGRNYYNGTFKSE